MCSDYSQRPKPDRLQHLNQPTEVSILHLLDGCTVMSLLSSGGLGRGGARAQPVRQSQLVMPATVPADAKYTLEQAQLVFKAISTKYDSHSLISCVAWQVLMQPAAAIHTFRTIAGILPSDIPKVRFLPTSAFIQHL